MTPQCVPVVEPLRHTDAPTGASWAPATGTVPPLKSLTTGCGVKVPFTVTSAKSPQPGNCDAVNVPCACPVVLAVLLPGCPQCPAVTKPTVTEKPTEQRARWSMMKGSPPRMSASVRGAAASSTTWAAPLGTSARASSVCAAGCPPVRATPTTWLLAGSTYQPLTCAAVGRPGTAS